MTPRRIRDLLDRIGWVRHPCDLDLLLFFHRHPRAVLTSERLAVYIGYDVARVAQSLDALISAELLTRVQRPTGSARVYQLTASGRLKGWVDALLRLGSTRTGRLAVIAELTRRASATEPSSGPGRAARTTRVRARALRLEVGHA